MTRRLRWGGWIPCGLALVLGLWSAGCSDRREPLMTAEVLGKIQKIAAEDGSASFAGLFCSVLESRRSQGEDWKECSLYLEPAGAAVPPPPLPDPTDRPKIMVIPGIFGRCIADEIRIYEKALENLRSLGFSTGTIDVSGLGGTEHNAGQILQRLRREKEADPDVTFILIGYSKGAPDAMEALVTDPGMAASVKALVSVAGAVAGSPLTDGVTSPMTRLIGSLAPGKCGLGDNKGVESLKQEVRKGFLAAHPEMPVPSYSLVGVVSREETSAVHQPSWLQLHRFSPAQDGQVIAYDAVIPSSVYLGAARADHWAVALPFEHANPAWKLLVNKNHYPREALLEAIVRFVMDDLTKQ